MAWSRAHRFLHARCIQNYDPTTRLIVDGTEIKTDGWSDPDQDKATFSYYKKFTYNESGLLVEHLVD